MSDRTSTSANLMIMGGGFIKPPRFSTDSMWHYLSFRGNYTPYHRQGGPISAHALTDDHLLFSVGILSVFDLGPDRYNSLDQVVSVSCAPSSTTKDTPVTQDLPQPAANPLPPATRKQKNLPSATVSTPTTTTTISNVITPPSSDATDGMLSTKDDPDPPSIAVDEEEVIPRTYRADGYLENSSFFKLMDQKYRIKRLDTFLLRLNDVDHKVVLQSSEESNLTDFIKKLIDLATITSPSVLVELFVCRTNREMLYRQILHPMVKKRLRDKDHELKSLREFIRYTNIFTRMERDFEETLQERKAMSLVVDASTHSTNVSNSSKKSRQYSTTTTDSATVVRPSDVKSPKFCAFHQSTTHNTAECRQNLQNKDRDGTVRNRPPTGNRPNSSSVKTINNYNTRKFGNAPSHSDSSNSNTINSGSRDSIHVHSDDATKLPLWSSKLTDAATIVQFAILPDSGSTICLAQPAFIAENNIPIIDISPVMISTANSELVCSAKATLNMTLFPYKKNGSSNPRCRKISVEVLVLPVDAYNDMPYQVILGHPFLLRAGLYSYFNKQNTHYVKGPRAQAFTMAEDIYAEDFDPASLNPDQIMPVGQDLLAQMQACIQLSSPAERAQMAVFLSQFTPLCEDGLPDEPSPDLDEFSIHLKDGAKIANIPYRGSSAKHRAAHIAHCQELLRTGQVRYSSSPYGCHCVWILKPDGTWRLCIDYGPINANTVAQTYPMELQEDVVRRVAQHHYFCKLDLKQWYKQLHVAEDSKYLTAFCSPIGLLEWNVLPEGLTNACAFCAQQVKTRLLHDLDGLIVESWFDDLIIYGDNIDQLITNMDTVFSRLMHAGVRIKLSKCVFGTNEVNFLGRLISYGQIKKDPKYLTAIKDLKLPTTKIQLAAFLGMANQFRTYIPNYHLLTAPFADLRKSKSKFNWTPTHTQAFDAIIDELHNTRILSFVDYNHDIHINTDASILGIGAVLYQVIDNQTKLIAFLSRSFNSTEQNWSTYEQELSAVIFALKAWDHLLQGHHLIIHTDHANIQALQKATSKKLWRWRLILQDFHYEINHVAGKSNVVADALSRCLEQEFINILTRQRTRANHSSSEPDTSTTNDIIASTDTLGRDSSIATDIQGDMTPSESSNSNLTDPILTENGYSSPDRYDLLMRFHNSVVGHHGIGATINKIKEQGFHWDNIYHDVKIFINNCGLCQKHRNSGDNFQAAQHHSQIFKLFEVLIADAVGPFPEDADGNKYVITVMCGFSRFTELYPAKSTDAASFLPALIDIYGRYGIPAFLRTDKGPQFDNELISMFIAYFEQERQFTLPYRPQSNGLVERRNQDLLKNLKILVHEIQQFKNWSFFLPLVQRILNTSYHSAIGTQPVKMVFGNNTMLSERLLPQFTPERTSTVQSHHMDPEVRINNQQIIDNLTKCLSDIHSAARAKQLVYINRHRSKQAIGPQPKIGDLVFYAHPKRPPTKYERTVQSGKFVPKWLGPMLVKEVLSQGNRLILQHPISNHMYTVHTEDCKPYVGNNSEETIILLADSDVPQTRISHIISHIYTDPVPEDGIYRPEEFDFLVQYADGSEPIYEPYNVVKFTAALDDYLLKNQSSHPELHF